MPPLTDTQPAGPFVEAKSRLAAAVESARDEIVPLGGKAGIDLAKESPVTGEDESGRVAERPGIALCATIIGS